MSLLYECISGLISGGLLSGIINTPDGDDLASVCVTKLRGFLVVGDSNLKYVGLLALTKLVSTHAHLVAEHADVVLDCVDDADISIRYRALELVVGMVDAESLPEMVGRLIRQLKGGVTGGGGGEEYVELEATEESDEEGDMEEEEVMGGDGEKRRGQLVVLELPDAYKRTVIRRIVEMCARDMYVNVSDFEWYLDVLVQLVRYAPPVSMSQSELPDDEDTESEPDDDEGRQTDDVGEEIGRELRNVAVRVRSVRADAVRYAEMLVGRHDGMFPAAGGGGKRVLLAAAWIVGEFSAQLTSPQETLNALLHPASLLLPPDTLAIYIHAIPKIYAALTGAESTRWSPERKSTVTLLTTRIIAFLEPLAISPNLEVQERSVEFLELFRLAAEAIAAQPASMPDAEEEYDPPLLLTQAIPAMFLGMELNPVAPRAQRKVPLPEGLDLDVVINPELMRLLAEAEHDSALGTDEEDDGDKGFREWYYVKPQPAKMVNTPASLGVDHAAARAFGGGVVGSYQGAVREEDYLDRDILERRKRDRRERERDDPFYIGAAVVGGGEEDVDIDSIPVMKLDLGGITTLPLPSTAKSKRRREKVMIAADEGIAGGDGDDGEEENVEELAGRKKGKRKGLLGVDSSGLTGYSLEGDAGEDEKRLEMEEEKAAMAEVARFRAEMEVAAERMKARSSIGEAKPKGKKDKGGRQKKENGEKGEKKKKKNKEGKGNKDEKKEKKKKKEEGEGEKKGKKGKGKEEQAADVES